MMRVLAVTIVRKIEEIIKVRIFSASTKPES